MTQTAKFDFDKILGELDAIANAKTVEAVRKIEKSIEHTLSDIDFRKRTKKPDFLDGASNHLSHP